ncbi:4Fe-4S dicluster domain-containing protein [Dehalobacter sp. DCM]|uniref:4Fe-4S dicluster domain-containing protein n=1 Tax=Dehalobacter sp. DCM TaxID=2907827 RepID=UPI0030812EAF|nr:4Fe-4S dicluster domain-containing protein [Dehalobacter sp. DCM]
MEQLNTKMRELAGELLEKQEAKLVIGWEKGNHSYISTPAFISDTKDVDRLVWDEYCSANLAKYLIDYRDQEGKVAVFVKGCDARGMNRLLQDNQIKREKIILIGLSCPGMKDDKAAEKDGDNAEIPMLKKCRECRYPTAVVYDQFLGENTVQKEIPPKAFADVQAVENLNPDQKYEYFTSNYEKCLRCNACRNVCPACNCRDCIFDHSSKGWLGKANDISDNMFFALTRAMHVAGRCIDCGECERVCPADIPIMLLNRKLIQDIDNLFGENEAGLDPEKRLPLGAFEYTDPEEFM